MSKLFLVPTKESFRRPKPTTIQLTPNQRIAMQELRIKRLLVGKPEPNLTEMVVEGLELLFKRERIEYADAGSTSAKGKAL